MQTQILAIGKLKEAYLQAGINEYSKRLQPWGRLQIIELAEEKLPQNPGQAEIEQGKIAEGKRILQALNPGSFHIALDLRGDRLSSEQLADKLQQLALIGRSSLSFSIGGSYGLSAEVINAANMRLSFGAMTFPHQLMRLILLEQLYRAYKINRGETYHK